MEGDYRQTRVRCVAGRRVRRARLGVNPRTVRAVEMGRPTVKVGTVFAYPTSSVSACSGWKAMSLSAPDAQGRTLSRCSRP